MFYIITFDDIESLYIIQLMADLENYPTGTIFSYSQRMVFENLAKDKWIIWVENNIEEQENDINKLSNLPGIKNIQKIDITNTEYENNYNNTPYVFFIPYL